MVEANNKGRHQKDLRQGGKAGNKRKHNKAYPNKGKGGSGFNWAEKRDKKRQKQQERERGGAEPYEIANYVIGSDRFNEYYKVGVPHSKVHAFQMSYSLAYLENLR